MTKQVYFNGVTLVRAGGATRVDASAFQNVGFAGIGAVGLIGEADDGAPNTIYAFTTPGEMASVFGSGPLADAADLAFLPMNDPRVPGGASVVYAVKVNQGTQAALTLKDSLTNDALTLTSKSYGLKANKITVEVATSGSGKTIEIIYEEGTKRVVETSPILGGTAEFTLEYTGAGSAASCAITDTTLTTTVTGAPADNLDLDFVDYPTLTDLINKINNTGKYTAVAITSNPYTFKGVDLDRVSAVDIKTAAGSFYAKLHRMVQWINVNSGLVTAVRKSPSPDGDLVPVDSGPTFLSGGTRGISSNSDWQDGFDLLGQVRCNQVVPLASEDLDNLGYGSTAEIAVIFAQADAHAAYYSSTAGKNERQCYCGFKGDKEDLLATAATFQSLHTVLSSQSIRRQDAARNMISFPEWGLAVIMAGGRAGSLRGEPLTYKFIRCSGISQDASWNPVDDGADLILAGCVFAFADAAGGFKFDRVTTTYTKDENDAYSEESVVQVWKDISYAHRTQLERIFTGVRGLPATVTGMLDASRRILDAYRDEGAIVDSVGSDGAILPAYRDHKVVLSGDVARMTVTISPVPGINFILDTLVLVPATMSA